MGAMGDGGASGRVDLKNEEITVFVRRAVFLVVAFGLAVAGAMRPADAAAKITGELKQWHTVTLSFQGPRVSEDSNPNPFLYYRLNVTLRHERSGKKYLVFGYFAGDGNAANSSADAGNVWRAEFCPNETGLWRYSVSFRKEDNVAVSADSDAGEPAGFCDGESGVFKIGASDKEWPDFRARGWLQYVGERYLRFAGSKEYFLKAGPDSPETLLAYEDFDGTSTRKTPLKRFRAHVRDWNPGDPVWKAGKGLGLIGALNYLASQGMNTLSFLTYNAGGDGDNVWPFVQRDEKTRYDCSKLDQWGIVFEHAQAKGLHLTIKTQETENDNDVPESLDGGDLGVERKLYYRELIARFGHLPALTWNLGEENSQTTAQQKAMAAYFSANDPYHHNISLHTFPSQQEQVYKAHLGKGSALTCASLQNGWEDAHQFTLWWVWESTRAGKPWVVTSDEQNGADIGVPPDDGYQGFSARALGRSADDIRKRTLWGNLMAGGAGVEYYFGYALPCNDLLCEDWRSREQSWKFARIALEFFREQKIPVQRMFCKDRLTPSEDDYVFCKEGEIYLVYLPEGGETRLELPAGDYKAGWFNPRTGEGTKALISPTEVHGPESASFAAPDAEDWLLVVRRK